MYSAYLIVICEEETNKILGVAIWSCPEWEASRRLSGVHTYIAYAASHSTFSLAREWIIQKMLDPKNRYHYLLKYMEKEDVVFDSTAQHWTNHDGVPVLPIEADLKGIDPIVVDGKAT